jgi:hypothetical protein
MFQCGARTLTIKFTKITDTPTCGICNRIKNSQIRFLIDPVADGTMPHIPKPSFNTLPYASGSFAQTIGGGGCGACGVVYLTPVAALPPAPTDISGGTKLTWPGLAEVGGMVEIGTGSGV